jgi:hypothetical protein
MTKAILVAPSRLRIGLNVGELDTASNGIAESIKMKKKPDLLLLVFVIFGIGVAVSAVGQVVGL